MFKPEVLPEETEVTVENQQHAEPSQVLEDFSFPSLTDFFAENEENETVDKRESQDLDFSLRQEKANLPQNLDEDVESKNRRLKMFDSVAIQYEHETFTYINMALLNVDNYEILVEQSESEKNIETDTMENLVNFATNIDEKIEKVKVASKKTNTLKRKYPKINGGNPAGSFIKTNHNIDQSQSKAIKNDKSEAEYPNLNSIHFE